MPTSSTSPSSSAPGFSHHLPLEVIARILTYTDVVAPTHLEWQEDSQCFQPVTLGEDGVFMATDSWAFPKALLLVSRNVRTLAKNTYFSNNSFLATMRIQQRSVIDNSLVEQSPTPLEAMTKLVHSLPASARKRVRHIALSISSPTLLRRNADLTSYKAMVALMKDELAFRRLHVSIYVGHVFHPGKLDYCHTPDGAAAVFRRYIGGLENVLGVQSVFVYLGWPKQIKNAFFRRVAAVLESDAMGPDYDAVAHGKLEDM